MAEADIATTHNFTIGSYNCQHFTRLKLDYLKHVMEQCDFLLLQEHCLYKSQSDLFSAVGDISYHMCSAMDEHKPLIGRPHGGTAILWKNDADFNVVPVETESDRLCCCKITKNDFTILLVCVYLPCDDRYMSLSYNKTLEILNDLLFLQADITHDAMLVAGDFNTDFSRTSPQVTAVQEMLKVAKLRSGIDHTCANIMYTFESKGSQVRSIIDHICSSSVMYECLDEYYTLQDVLNMSDHDALLASFRIDITSMTKRPRSFTPRPAWYKAEPKDITMYSNNVDHLLNSVQMPMDALQCQDARCTEHEQDILKYYEDIMSCCLMAESSCIPTTGKGKSTARRIPGWNDHVRGKYEQALYFHSLWKDQGRPLYGDIYENMRQARRDYHYAVRFCKKNQDKITATKMAEALAKNKSREFWGEIKRSKAQVRYTPGCIDNCNDEIGIANIFQRKFKDLYNSVSYDEHEMRRLRKTLDDSLDYDAEQFITTDCKWMSGESLYKLASELKAGKNDGIKGISSDCLINGSRRLMLHISMLFRMMVMHGVTPRNILTGTMIPIPKVKGAANTSDKFRAVTLSSSVSKLFDLYLLTAGKSCLKTDDLQFGFKVSSSTTLCTSLLNEINNYYISKGNKTYSLFLDASKAFDRVNFVKLFGLLIKRGLNSLIVRFLLNLYTRQTLCVKWNNTATMSFNVSNGVRQGGVASPVLFCVYLDEMLQRLRNSGYGCHIGPHFAGVLAYADDVVLLSPNLFGLTQMAEICTDYAREFDLSFNASKSQFIVFGNDNNGACTSFRFMNVNIPCSDHICHLGHKLFANVTRFDLEGITATFYKQFNNFRSKFAGVPSFVQSELFHVYCSSFYGYLLLPLDKCIKKLQIVWRKSMRQVWKLPYRTHCQIVSNLSSKLCEFHMLIKRNLNFALKCINHSIAFVKYLFTCAMNSDKSVFQRNVKFCCQNLDLIYDELTDVDNDIIFIKCEHLFKRKMH